MRKLLIFSMLALLATTATRAAEVVYYTLDGTTTGGSSGYATESEMTQSSMTWMVMGNTNQSPWRIGGKDISNENRTIKSITAMANAITKVAVTIGTASDITVNSFKLTVASDDAFTNVIDEVTRTFAANSTITFEPSSNSEWSSGAYYKFTFNVTVTDTKNNKYLQFSSAAFYMNEGGQVITPGEVTFSPNGGNVISGDEVKLTSSSAYRIYYTLNGTAPTTSSSHVNPGGTVAITGSVNSTVTLTAVGYASDLTTHGAQASATYSIVEPEEYELVQNVSSLSEGDEIIIMSSSTDDAYALSTVQNTNNRAATSATRTITNNGIVYPTADTQVLTLEGSSAGWYFNTGDGYLYAASSSENHLRTEPTADDNAKALISINNNAANITFQGTNTHNILKYNSNNGNPIFSCYTTSGSVFIFKKVASAPQTVATPTFTPNAGSYNAALNVTITCDTEDATIYYTTDGSVPTTASSVYADAISVSETTTIKALAVKDGMTNSAVASATYKIETNTFVLVTDELALASGNDFVIVATTSDNVAMGSISTSNYSAAKATGFSRKNDVVTLNSGSDVVVYSLGGSAGSWTITDSNGNILGVSSNSFELNPSPSQTWSITISNDGVAKITNSVTSTRQIVYRASSYNYFKNFASNNINGAEYYNVMIFKRKAVTYPEVVGIAAFKEVASGTTVKLKLTDESNARVLHVASGTGNTVDAYVRDNSGALLLKGITPNRTMAYNQHLAGWIVGEYSVDATTGLPQLVPVADTNTAELVIADPVTEATTLPVEIDAADMDDYLADWATVKNIRMGGSGAPVINNVFSASGYSSPYSGALVDINGIVADDAIYPMTEDASEYPLVTYVLDAAQDFTAPSTAVANVPVRWQRTFVADRWTPVTVPFAISDFDGVVMRYISLSDGGITTTSEGSYSTGQMNFSQVSSIEAGVPYLVKTDESFSSMILDGVTITTTPAQTLSYTTNGAVTNGGNGAPMRTLASGDTYSMVGTYSPTTVTEANTNKLVVGGEVVWSGHGNGDSVEGSSAYITTPKNQAIKLNMGGEEVITGINTIEAPVALARMGTYNLLGMKMPDDWSQLPPGIYIVNGKKVVKQ